MNDHVPFQLGGFCFAWRRTPALSSLSFPAIGPMNSSVTKMRSTSKYTTKWFFRAKIKQFSHSLCLPLLPRASLFQCFQAHVFVPPVLSDDPAPPWTVKREGGRGEKEGERGREREREGGRER